MSADPLHLPVLRAGEWYASLDTLELRNIAGTETLATISQANAGLIRRDLIQRLHGAQESLDAFSSADLISICQKAAELFMSAELPIGNTGSTQSAEEYVAVLSATTGLPHTLCRANMDKVRLGMAEMETILAGLTRGLDPVLFDQHITDHSGLEVGFFRAASSLGVVLPSNSPGVNTLWLPALPMKVPVVLKPGREDPWTPLRIIAAFIEAGAPAAAFSFYPCGHDGAEDILRNCGRGIVFGGDATVKKYATNPRIQTHGTGRSKVLIGEDKIANWTDYLDCLEQSVAGNSGRSCINTSQILVPSHGREIAVALAERLASRKPLPLDDPNAALAGFANPMMAEATLSVLEDDLATAGAEDVSKPFRGEAIRADVDGLSYLLPTIAFLNSTEHPLFEREFLFPCASVVEVPQAEMLDVIGTTLVVTAITDDKNWRNDLMACPEIDRLNFGPMPTNKVQWDQPHEGNLFEFLYQRRAVQWSHTAA